MLLQMGFQDDRWRTRYEKLTSIDDEKTARPRRRWVTKMNGKLRGLRLSRSRRVNWKAFSIVILPRKITDMYADIVSRTKMDDICPTIVFSGPWGLPFLSHSNAKCKSAISLHRNLACFQ
ncbi:hypothetical protein LOK49_LG02G02521 [Camellia lanceoleosa]|uniref:Uncharacterized protein n=1 Tax=Camellia lanceoleosa TaxID=1840588 RepID=A0ACC0ISZ9_9ERIC|nr:hypothetical protein LOK49_LG02G02521 [Camellia lanceoleosa]